MGTGERVLGTDTDIGHLGTGTEIWVGLGTGTDICQLGTGTDFWAPRLVTDTRLLETDTSFWGVERRRVD
jgi:hypothetical protein